MLLSRTMRWGVVLWLVLHAGVSAAALGAVGGARLPWPSLPGLFAAHAAVSLFFLVFLWPLLIPAVVRAEGGSAGGRAMAGPLLLFAALGAPFALLGARLSGTGGGEAARSVAILIAVAACASAAFAGRRAGLPRVGVLYQMGAWAACAGAPFLYYLGREWGGADWAWLAAVSPFRGVVDPTAATGWGPLWAVQAAAYGALAAVLAGTARVRGRAVAGGGEPA